MSGPVKAFITDLGKSVEIKEPDGGSMRLGRYGVWVQGPGDRKPQVIETSDDLADLMARHQIPEDRVYRLSSRGEERSDG